MRSEDYGVVFVADSHKLPALVLRKIVHGFLKSIGVALDTMYSGEPISELIKKDLKNDHLHIGLGETPFLFSLDYFPISARDDYPLTQAQKEKKPWKN